MFLYIQTTQLSLQWIKNFSLDCKAASLSRKKAINKYVYCECKSLMVLFAVDAKPWNNQVNQHSVLPYLSSHHHPV